MKGPGMYSGRCDCGLVEKIINNPFWIYYLFAMSLSPEQLVAGVAWR
jgi:hypothetical protein